MKYLISIVLLFSGITDPVTKIAKSNALKKEAKEAYNSENYEQAVSAYGRLLDSLQVRDDDAQLNLANAAYLLAYGNNEKLGILKEASKNPENLDSSSVGEASKMLEYASLASRNYDELSKSASDITIASNAYNQKGIISYKQSETAEAQEKESFTNDALNSFKNALRKNPANESARYNYELLKKLIRQQEQQQQEQKDDQKKEDQKKDQENKDKQEQDKQNQDKEKQEQEKDQEKQENQEQQNKDQQNKDEQKENQEQDPEQKPEEQDPLEKLKEKLKEMNIPLEKAEMILEAMKNNEVQYVQQNKRKATKKKDSSKPDW